MAELYEGNEPFIFVSYARADSAMVLPYIEALESAGYRVWYDRHIEPAAEWPKEIAEQVHLCYCLLAFMSGAAARSRYCNQEVYYASKLGKRMLVVYVEDVDLDAVDRGLSMTIGKIEAIRRKDYVSEESFRKELLHAKVLEPCMRTGAVRRATTRPAAGERTWVQSDAPRNGHYTGSNNNAGRRVMLAIILAACAVLAYRWGGFADGGNASDIAPVSSMEEQVFDEGFEAIVGDYGSADSDRPPIKSSIAEYSWDELSHIAGQIESCSDYYSAVSLAEDYNLLDEGGVYRPDTKDFTLGGNRVVHMRLVGVWHDDADTASGKAGLSLLSDGIIDSRPLAYTETISGGWKDSAMEAWLSNDLWNQLPEEVSSAIVPVYKAANNEGYARSVDCVWESSERIWLPSTVELCGPVNWTYVTDPDNSSLYNSIINAEGRQYPAFEQEGILNDAANDSLAFGGQWWMRTLSPVKGNGRYVEADGDPMPYGSANKDRGVVIGFCL